VLQDALAKAKAQLLLEKQKALREKLAKLKGSAAGAAAGAAGQPSAAALAATANPLAPGVPVGGSPADLAARAAMVAAK
jgi:hypothetical protein